MNSVVTCMHHCRRIQAKFIYMLNSHLLILLTTYIYNRIEDVITKYINLPEHDRGGYVLSRGCQLRPSLLSYINIAKEPFLIF